MFDFNIVPFVESTGFLIIAWLVMAVIFSVALVVGNRVKYIVVPLLFGLISFTVLLTADSLGRPVSAVPTGEFLLIHFETNNTDRYGETILLWIKAKQRHRMYRMPFSEEVMKQLLEARERRKRTGQAQLGNFGNESEKSHPGEFRTYNFPYQERLRKNGN